MMEINKIITRIGTFTVWQYWVKKITEALDEWLIVKTKKKKQLIKFINIIKIKE